MDVFTIKKTSKFCRISRGSLYELIDQTDIAFEEAYIDKNKFDSLNTLIVTCIKILNGYINYLKKAKEQN